MNTVVDMDSRRPKLQQRQPSTTDVVTLVGRVSSGRGKRAAYMGTYADEIQNALGQRVVDGSLNILLNRPIILREDTAIKTWCNREPGFDWQGRLNGLDVWIHRSHTAPLHTAELLCTVPLRTHFGLSDGDAVRIEVRRCDLGRVSSVGRAAWFLFWFGRTSSTYRDSPYRASIQKRSERYGATQQGTTKSLLDLALAPVKKLIKKIPGARRIWRRLRRLGDSGQDPPQIYHFERLPLDGNAVEPERTVCQIRNLLSYTKTSGSLYAAKMYPAGYHTLEINGQLLRGKRNPADRLKPVPFDFDGRTVLDVGCNQGGMLFQLPCIKWGVGVDYDPHMINVANRIRDFKHQWNLSFYVMDLERDPLDLIEDCLPESKVDIVFLLAVCGWLDNWKPVIDWCAEVSGCMLYETTGPRKFQETQIRYLEKRYKGNTRLLAERSEDDPDFKTRKLLYCGGQ